MQSCLYLESTLRTDALARLTALRRLPGLAGLRDLRCIDCLTVDAPYPAETIAPILRGLGVTVTTTLPLDADTRCLPLADADDRETAMLLAAAGIDAAITRTPLLLLRGLDEVQYRTVRDALSRPLNPTTAGRHLPDDAFYGFISTPTDRLAHDAALLGLTLPEPCLDAIAAHYRKLGRDPWPDELLILDEAYRQALDTPAAYAPIEFATDDPRLHAAYADMMAKRRALDPNADSPATLGALSALATRYLCAHRGKPLPAPSRFTDRRTIAAMGGRCIGGFADRAGEVCLYLADRTLPTAPIAVGDHLLLVLPTDAAADSFTAALERFFATAQIASTLRRSLPVEPGRLIAALGYMLGDSGYGLSLMQPAERAPLLEALTPEGHCLLLACAPAGARTVPAALRAAGLRFVHLAAVTKRPLLTLESEPSRLCIPTAMLSPRPTFAAVHAAIPAPPIPETEPLPALLAALASPAMRHTMGYNPTTARLIAQAPAELVSCSGRLLCASAVEQSGDPYTAVRDTALSLIARLTAAGLPLDGITLHLAATLPLRDRETCGASLAALLGLHTVEVELGIPAAPADLRHGDTLTVTLSAEGKKPEQAPPLSPYDSPLWLCAPRSTDPHLNGEAALLKLAAAEIAAGHAAIATGLLPPSVAVSRLGYPLTLTAPAEVLRTPIPCGIVIASPEMPVLPDGVAAIRLGTTSRTGDAFICAGETEIDYRAYISALRGDFPAPILPPPTELLPPRISAHRYARPRVVIPYLGEAPTALADAVASLGGEALLCPIALDNAAIARQSLSAYADMLETAQLLLLPDDRLLTTALLTQRRAADAMAALRARDGLVCAWGGAFAALLALGCFSPDGSPITAAPLTGVTMLTTVLTSSHSPWLNALRIGHKETALLALPPLCPTLSSERRMTMADAGLIAAVAVATPDGTPAVTALSSPDGSLLGLAIPPSILLLDSGIGYFR